MRRQTGVRDATAAVRIGATAATPASHAGSGRRRSSCCSSSGRSVGWWCRLVRRVCGRATECVRFVNPDWRPDATPYASAAGREGVIDYLDL